MSQRKSRHLIPTEWARLIGGVACVPRIASFERLPHSFFFGGLSAIAVTLIRLLPGGSQYLEPVGLLPFLICMRYSDWRGSVQASLFLVLSFVMINFPASRGLSLSSLVAMSSLTLLLLCAFGLICRKLAGSTSLIALSMGLLIIPLELSLAHLLVGCDPRNLFIADGFSYLRGGSLLSVVAWSTIVLLANSVILAGILAFDHILLAACSDIVLCKSVSLPEAAARPLESWWPFSCNYSRAPPAAACSACVFLVS